MPRSGSRVMALWTRVMLDEVTPGWRDAGWLEAHDLAEPGALRSEAPMIPHEDMIRAWTAATDAHPDPWFGVRFAERHARGAVGLLTYAGAHAADLRSAIASLLRMQRLADTHNQVELVEEGDVARVFGAPSPGVGRWPRHLAESVVAGLLQIARSFTGHPIRAREVSFEHAGDASIETWFGGPVHFEAGRNEIVLDRTELDRPLSARDPLLFEALEAAGARQLERVAPATGLAARVTAALRELPPTRRSVDEVADALALSSRSLQRKLADEGVTFRQLVADLRTGELAELSATGAPAKDAVTAENLGYRSTSSVRRLRARRRTR